MSKYRYFRTRDGAEVDELEACHSNGTVRGLRVNLRMADSLAREMADHFRPAWEATKRSQISDGTNNPYALHKPGFRVADGRDLDARQRMYDQADLELSQRWRSGK
jgi:hypothetical protein